VVEEILGKMVKRKTQELTVEKIQQVVCDYFKIPEESLKEKTRKREIAQARHLAMYFSKNYTKNSLAYIGNQIGKKDHSTVLYACRVVTNLLATDRKFKMQVEEIQQKLYSLQ
jgi:chromosomal replication initiator protein